MKDKMEKEKYREKEADKIYEEQVGSIYDAYFLWSEEVNKWLEGDIKTNQGGKENKITGKRLYELAIKELNLHEKEKYEQKSINRFLEKNREIFGVKDGYFISGLLKLTRKKEVPHKKTEFLEITGKKDVIDGFISIPGIKEISALGFLNNTFLEIRGEAGMLLGRNSYQSIIEVEEAETLGLDTEDTDYFLHKSKGKPFIMGSGRIWYKKNGEWELY